MSREARGDVIGSSLRIPGAPCPSRSPCVARARPCAVPRRMHAGRGGPWTKWSRGEHDAWRMERELEPYARPYRRGQAHVFACPAHGTSWASAFLAPPGHVSPAGRAPCSAQRSCLPARSSRTAARPDSETHWRASIRAIRHMLTSKTIELHTEHRNHGEHLAHRDGRRWSDEEAATTKTWFARTKGSASPKRTASTYPACRTNAVR